MLPETRRLDLVFKWIKTTTILLASLYLIGCYLLIRKKLPEPDAAKVNYSLGLTPKTSGAAVEIALKKPE